MMFIIMTIVNRNAASTGGHWKSLVPLRSDAFGEATEGWPRRASTAKYLWGNLFEESGFHHLFCD